ncbi:glycine zipper 2TM domain-containing protein [Povalibacter sp.]|uniref:glycine zipper 2TM domain-containing protein n=1 Tax=Povalibacter sp. TaxID=1962978 RepID=UPI002F42F7DE
MAISARAASALVILAGLSVTSITLAAPPSWSNSRHNRADEGYDYAPVVRAEPIVRQIRVETPRRECWNDVHTVESRPHISEPAVGGRTLLGGIIGGVIGHQFGSGRGRDAATVAGAAIGAGVGYDSARRVYGTSTSQETVQRCEVRHEEQYEERIDGYRVTYEYHGRQYTTRMPYDPGSQIRVRVAVAPAE